MTWIPAQTLRRAGDSTDPIALTGAFNVVLFSSLFDGIASLQKSLDHGATWESCADFPMKHVKGELLRLETNLDEPDLGVLYRGHVTEYESGAVIVAFTQS
jgi:hypothetical protein